MLNVNPRRSPFENIKSSPEGTTCFVVCMAYLFDFIAHKSAKYQNLLGSKLLLLGEVMSCGLK